MRVTPRWAMTRSAALRIRVSELCRLSAWVCRRAAVADFGSRFSAPLAFIDPCLRRSYTFQIGFFLDAENRNLDAEHPRGILAQELRPHGVGEWHRFELRKNPVQG